MCRLRDPRDRVARRGDVATCKFLADFCFSAWITAFSPILRQGSTWGVQKKSTPPANVGHVKSVKKKIAKTKILVEPAQRGSLTRQNHLPVPGAQRWRGTRFKLPRPPRARALGRLQYSVPNSGSAACARARASSALQAQRLRWPRLPSAASALHAPSALQCAPWRRRHARLRNSRLRCARLELSACVVVFN